MSGLQWVRVDTGFPSHDKTLALHADPSPKRYQAAASAIYGLCWSAAHGTDGYLPRTVLPFIHATPATAALLVKHKFWVAEDDGWRIVNYAERQELAVVTAMKKEGQRIGALKTNCKRYPPAGCTCWETPSDSL